MKKIISLSNIFFVLLPITFGICITSQNTESKIKFSDHRIKAMATNIEEDKDITELVKDNKIDVLVRLNCEKFTFNNDEKDPKEYKRKLLEAGREFFAKQNAEIMTNIDTSNLNDLYVSKYGPFFSFSIDEDEFASTYQRTISSFQLDESIGEIIMSKQNTYVSNETFSDYKEIVSLGNYTSDYTFDGTGIKIGLLESTILDIDHINFTDANVTVRDEWYYIETVGEHSTAMASIMVGPNGLVPNADIYSVSVSGDLASEIDWLLDNEIDIVNMSYGDANPTGVYSTNSAYVDYIANTYKTIFVAAAGNFGLDTGYVGNPGLGYNVITIGNCDVDCADTIVTSSYKEVDGPEKPNICAPGENLFIPNISTYSGTSVACAVTTACIAAELDHRPTLITHPEQMMALLYANNKTMQPRSNYIGLDEYIGVGAIDMDGVFSGYSRMIKGTNSASSGFELVSSVVMEQGQKIKIAGCWLAKADGDADNTTFTDYDLLIRDTSLVTHAVSNSVINNLEYIEFVAPQDDTYTFSLYQVSEAVQTDSVAVAYSIS